MGHSFGCVVVCAAVAGPLKNGQITSRLPRPVESMFLVQGAMSLWSFADVIPFSPPQPGHYRSVEIDPPLVRGPIVTSQSTFDRAVGTFFPLGAELGNELTHGDDDFPKETGPGYRNRVFL